MATGVGGAWDTSGYSQSNRPGRAARVIDTGLEWMNRAADLRDVVKTTGVDIIKDAPKGVQKAVDFVDGEKKDFEERKKLEAHRKRAAALNRIKDMEAKGYVFPSAENGFRMFAEGGETRSNLPITNNAGELTGYNMFRGTLPGNQAINGSYDLFTGWKDYGKPADFRSAMKPHGKNSEPWMSRESDGYHAKSVGYNESTGNYDFLKDKNHETISREIDWYNSSAGSEFRGMYDLDTSGDYYKYTPKKSILEVDRGSQLFAEGGNIFSGDQKDRI